jgi:hypothetical protein
MDPFKFTGQSPRTDRNAVESGDRTSKRQQLQRMHDAHKRSHSLDLSLVGRHVKSVPAVDHRKISATFDREGVVDRKALRSLIEGAFARQGTPLSKAKIDEFVTAFCNGATNRCDYVLGRLLAAQTRQVDLDRLHLMLEGSHGWTLANLPVASQNVERYAIHDIARQFAHCKNEASFRAALRQSLQQSKLTPEVAKTFTANAKGLVLAGRSAIVLDEIAQHGKRKL